MILDCRLVPADRQGAHHQQAQTELLVEPQDVPSCSNDDYLLAGAFRNPADLAITEISGQVTTAAFRRLPA